MEDQPSDAELLLLDLRRGGYVPSLLRVETAAELSAALADGAWDLVIADYALPQFDGLSALSLVRAACPELPFILMSGVVDEETAAEAMVRGAQDLVLKSRRARLLPAIERELAESRLRREKREGEAQAAAILDSLATHVAVLDRDGVILAVNRAWRDFAAANGADPAQVGVGADYLRVCDQASDEARDAAAVFAAGARAVIAGELGVFEHEYTCHSPREQRWFLARVVPVPGGSPGCVVVTHENLTAAREMDAERRTIVELLSLLNGSGDLRDLIATVTAYLQRWSGCAAAGIRLREGDDFPYFETRGFGDEFVAAESQLCVSDSQGQAIRGESGEVRLACMCGTVLRGQGDPTQPFFTARGSFWTNSTGELLANTTAEERRGETRNRCHAEGYESVALVPMRLGGETLGLIQLNDPQQGRFSPHMLALLERMADSIAIALAQRQTAHALRQSEERYRRIIAIAGEGVWLIDEQLRTTFVNQRLLDILGYGEHEMLGREPAEFVFAEDMARHRIRLAERHAGVSSRFEQRYRAGDGSERWMTVSATPVLRADGSFEGSVAMCADVTESKRAEQRLRESEERFRSVSSVVADFAYSCRRGPAQAGSELDWMTGDVERITGYTPDEVMARHCWQYLVDEADRDVFARSVVGLSAGQEAICELRIRTKQGAVRWLRSSARCEPHPHEPGVQVLYGGCVDITADHELQEMLRLQALVLDQIQDRVTVTDLQGRIRYVNHAQAHGIGMLPEELIGQHVEQYGDDPVRGATQEEIIETTLRDGVWRGRVVNRDAVGREIVVEARTSVVRDAAGQVVALSGAATDVTERVAAEEALRASEERFRTIANLTYDWETWIGPDGKLLWISPSVERFTGYTDAQCYAMPDYPLPLIHPDDHELVKEHFRAALGGAVGNDIDYRVTRTDGEVLWLSICYRPVVDANGRSLGHRASSRDVTARKLAEEALRQSEEKFAKSFHSSPDAVVLARLDDRRIVDVNEGFCTLAGFDRDAAIGATASELGLWLSDEDADRCNQLLRAYGRVRNVAARFRTKAGEVRDCLVSAEVVQLAGDRHALFTVRDETERLLAEVDRARLQEQLLQSQRMESVGRLAGGVAHDFNNMLGVIMGNAEMAMADLSESDPLYGDLHEISIAAQRSAELTGQLLAFARRQTAAPKVLDLNDTVVGTLKMLRRLIGEDIDLAWLPGPSLWTVHMDPAQVGQILTNLCVNARHAIADVGRVTIETANVVLSSPVEPELVELPDGDYVRLTVQDNGCGMDSEVLAHVFEPFYTTKSVGEGTGLGLATVYGIVMQNAGGIVVESALERGTTFRIYLPRAAWAGPEPAELAPTQPPRGAGQAILVVEDDLATLRLTERILRSLNYVVLPADSPEVALELAASPEWSAAAGSTLALLLTDVVMPQMSGRELSERIAALQPGIRCLFMSGYTADVIAHRGVLDEGLHFVGKPFSVLELAQKVREVLDGESSGG